MVGQHTNNLQVCTPSSQFDQQKKNTLTYIGVDQEPNFNTTGGVDPGGWRGYIPQSWANLTYFCYFQPVFGNFWPLSPPPHVDSGSTLLNTTLPQCGILWANLKLECFTRGRGEAVKNTFSQRRKEGRVEKKSACSAPMEAPTWERPPSYIRIVMWTTELGTFFLSTVWNQTNPSVPVYQNLAMGPKSWKYGDVGFL